MLAVDLLELLGRVLGILLAVQKIEALVVELVGRLVGNDRILVEQAAGAERNRHKGERREPRDTRAPPSMLLIVIATPIHGSDESRAPSEVQPAAMRADPPPRFKSRGPEADIPPGCSPSKPERGGCAISDISCRPEQP